ncbi:hypothetical protein [Megasphaera sp. ASD88]|nr:hypothetical protein [Megasphaera sp. ASD88]
MRYTIPQLEGLAEAISEINKDIKTDDDDTPLTGKDAVAALQARGLF